MRNKFIAIAMVLLLVSSSGWARELSKVITDFKKIENVTYVGLREKILLYFLAKKVNKMSGLKKNSNRNKPAKFIRRLSRLAVVNIESAQMEKTAVLRKEVNETLDNEYNVFIKVRHEEDDIKIYTKGEVEKIRELLILVEDKKEKDIVMVFIKGKFNMKDIEFDNEENFNFLKF